MKRTMYKGVEIVRIEKVDRTGGSTYRHLFLMFATTSLARAKQEIDYLEAEGKLP